jgi:arylsulfatase A-like enzyme
MGKQNLYDHSMRIPLIMRGPGVPDGIRSGALLYLLDLYPTLLEAAGLSVPAGAAGHSMAALLRQDTYMHRRQIFSAYQGVYGDPQGAPYQRSIKNDRNKLIQTVVAGEVTWQLFDLSADPYETKNLIDDPAKASLVDQLKRSLRERQTRADDPVLSGV